MVKKYTCQYRGCKFDPWVGKVPWGRKGNLLQYSCLAGYSPWGHKRVGHDWTLLSFRPRFATDSSAFTLWVWKALQGSPGGTSGKEPTCQPRRLNRGSIPGSGRSLGGGHGNPLQCSWLENPMGWGAWRTTVHGVTNSSMWLRWLSTHPHTNITHPIFTSWWFSSIFNILQLEKMLSFL